MIAKRRHQMQKLKAKILEESGNMPQNQTLTQAQAKLKQKYFSSDTMSEEMQSKKGTSK